MRHRARAGTALLGLVLAACSAVAPSPSGPSFDPAAIGDPARMRVEPERVAPGELVALTFPAGDERGLLFALDRPAGAGWERLALLFSDANGGQPAWFPADREVAVEAIGIGGPGPDRVPIPEELPAGTYRICTANAVAELCAAIEVLPPEPTR